jgi:hypothetical protein
MTETAIEKTGAAPLALVQPVSIEALIGAALAEGRSAEEVKQIHELYRDVKADQAREAFNRAFVQFKELCPKIPRNRKTDQYTRVTADGRQVPGTFADLETITKIVDPVLLQCRMSYRWTDTQLVEGLMVVVCRLAHVDGHSEDSPSPPFPIGKPIMSRAGKQVQSVQQVSASTSTYARRYSLISALGLTTVDEDDDGRGDNGEPAETITEEQARELNDLLIAATATTGECEAWTERLLKRAGVETLGEVPVPFFEDFAKKLQDKIDADRKEGT